MIKFFTLLLIIVSFSSTSNILLAQYKISSALDLPDEDLTDNIWYPQTLRAAIENINQRNAPAMITCELIQNQTVKVGSSLPAMNVAVDFDGNGIILEPITGSITNDGLIF